VLQDADLMVVSEALNAVFDSYADAHQEAFTALGMLATLRALLPSLQAKVRAEARSLEPAVAERAKEAVLNLKRFIRYKQQA
ncbi:MAG: hypothetical protein ACK4ZJ_17890, partial [Allorhizobium sp.]